jgi:serine protease inhibitor
MGKFNTRGIVMRFSIKIAAIIAALFCLLGNLAPLYSAENKPSANEETKLASAMNDFGFGMFRHIWPEGKPVNYAISPLSISLALSMTYNGADGETKTEMAKVLGYPAQPDEQVNRFNNELITRLQSADPKTTFNIANALWANRNVKFNSDFLKVNETFYKARISNLDFANASSLKEINDWVKEQTKGKIPTLIDQINADAILYLTNAVYFKGPWSKPFDKESTKPQEFHLIGGTTKTVPFMMRFGSMHYVETPEVQAVRLPYGNSSYAMYVVLPAKSGSLMNYIDRLDADKWTALLGKMTGTSGEIRMPRFRLEYKKELNDTLKGVGMRLAFDPNKADFSRMSEVKDVFVNKVVHKTYVDVNEEGTEAAAATSVEMMPASAPMIEKPFTMVVDRPFMFAIADEQTGGLIFMGAVVEP